MKLKSFGCSFIYGTDLDDCVDNDLHPGNASHSTWPALLAKYLNYNYECHAVPGIGNLQIYHRILTHLPLLDSTLFVINWSWSDRFDFLDPLQEHWDTLRPGGIDKTHELYYKYFYNQYHSLLTNLSYINSTISLLKKYNINFIMTAMDPILFEPIDPTWQDPKSISLLQKEIKPYITYFEGQTFLDWSKKKGYPISDTLHPLEPAHRAGFELIKSYNLV